MQSEGEQAVPVDADQAVPPVNAEQAMPPVIHAQPPPRSAGEPVIHAQPPPSSAAAFAAFAALGRRGSPSAARRGDLRSHLGPQSGRRNASH